MFIRRERFFQRVVAGMVRDVLNYRVIVETYPFSNGVVSGLIPDVKASL